jgi:hypothetical protein
MQMAKGKLSITIGENPNRELSWAKQALRESKDLK